MPTNYITSPQSNLIRARRSSANKTNSKLLGSYSPSMLTVRSRSCIWPPRSASLSLLSQWTCCICFVTFLHMNFSSTPTSILNLTIIRKGIRHRIQRYTVRTEILPIFHTSRLSISMSVYPYVAIVKYWTQMPNNARKHARNSPFPLRHVDFI